MKSTYVFTGAYDCGKTTTLQRMAAFGVGSVHSYRIHGEAHGEALRELGDRSWGHAADRPFTRSDVPGHICPMCHPLEFARRVHRAQRSLERQAEEGDLLDRGWLDPVEYYQRNSARATELPWTRITDYRIVFLFEVMPALQRPRWGKTQSERVVLAHHINARLRNLYRANGYRVMPVVAGTVDKRCEFIHAQIQTTK